jgi:uncharacterized protein YajQ (UPF0234 family)
MNPIVQWVLRTMMKGQTGVVRALPKKELLDLNVNITVERLIKNGIDPSAIKTPDQVDNIIKQIEAPRNVQQGITSTKSAKVMDMEGKEIKNTKNIIGGKELTDSPLDDLKSIVDDYEPMGGKQAETEAEIAARINRENKKSVGNIKNKMTEIDEAIDNASPGFAGDRKYDAQLVADDLAEKRFGKEFYDLDQKQQMDLYDEALEGLAEQKRGMPDPEDMAQGGRAGFRAGLGKRFLELLKGKPKPKFDVERFREGPIDLKFLENISKKDAEPFIRSRDMMGPGGYGMYDDFADMPAGLKAAELISRIKTKDGGINYSMAEMFIGKKLKGNESVDELIEMVVTEKKADGGRIGYKLGSIDKARRAFLKTMGVAGAGITALKTGLLGFGKGADAVKNIPPIKTPVTKLTDTTTQMPDWFPSFINKFRDEGKAKDVFKTKKVEVSKEEFDQAFKEGKGENYFSDVARTSEYKANNPDHMDYYKRVDTDERIYTTYTNDKVPGVRVDDMDGNVDVMFENDYSQPVSMNYTAPGKRGPETGRADVFVQGDAKMQTKSKGEFVANDVEVYATDPDGGSESVDVIADTVDDMLEGKTRQMEEYVTGKKTKLSRGEEKVGEAEFQTELAAERAAEDAADEFASGGIARMLGE